MGRRFSRVAAATLLALGGSGAAAWATPTASVTFVHPETYTDASYERRFASEREQAALQRDIARHLQQLAECGLPDGAVLRVEVLDIDLAGHFEPWRQPGGDLRILRDITWPRIKLRYAVTRGGDDPEVALREDTLTSQNYLMEVNRYPGSDRLRYEKAMLDDWFARRVAGR